MHPNEALLHKLFAALNAHDAATMAQCYGENATFTDIAFNLEGRQEIQAMWRLVTDTDIQTTVNSLTADDTSGHASIIDNYTFNKTNDNDGRPVRNEIESRFRFTNGLISEHHDKCDPLVWARQAFGGLKGELAGRIACLRRHAAKKKLEPYLP